MGKKQEPSAAIGVPAGGQQIVLCDLRLLNSSCALTLGKKGLADLRQSMSTLAQKINFTAVRDAEGPRIAFKCSLSLVGTYPDGQEGLRVEATFGLAYAVRWLDGITDEQLGQLGQGPVVNAVWPYWRDYVRSMTSRMGLPPLRMPLLRPAELQFAPQQTRKGPGRPGKTRPKEGQ
jgi:hypothetical protein